MERSGLKIGSRLFRYQAIRLARDTTFSLLFPIILHVTKPSDSRSTNFSLIERVLVDDSRAWRELVELYGPLVAHWCRRLSIPERAVQDCVQNVFLAVLKALPNFEAQPAADSTHSSPENRYGFRAWLWGITRHKCLDMRRSEGRQPQPAGGSTMLGQLNEEPALPTDEWEEFTEAQEITQLLRRAMAQVECEFESRTWQVFWRTTVDGLPTAVVAEELAVDPATVRQYRSRVLRRLRKQLGEN